MAPTLANILQRAIELQLRGIFTMLPGRIESYDPATQLANVKPLLKVSIPGATTADGETTEAELSEELPIIPNVKVQFPRVRAAVSGGTLDAHMYFPVKAGAEVMLIFSMMSLDKWSAGDGLDPIDPQDPRHHDLSDSIAIVGMYPDGTPISGLDDDDIRIVLDHPVGGRSEIGLGGDTGDAWLIPDPAVACYAQLGEKDAAELGVLGETLHAKLYALLDSFKTNAAAIVNTGVGPGSLNPTVLADIGTFLTGLADILCEKVKVS